jgi:deazaflavin-dependent oxidoreductase (nitroreductase family)
MGSVSVVGHETQLEKGAVREESDRVVARKTGHDLGPSGVGVDMPEVTDFNQRLIAEFRANRGTVGGPFDGATLLLLHTTGAKTGRERVNPLAYQKVGNSFAVFASKGGAPDNPDWYRNLLAHPKTTIEVGNETIEVTARVASADEREPIWSKQKQVMPGFAEYEVKTSRQIPVVILERV